nr:multiple drug resistance protein [Kwoniella dejecticola CBS 10117]OBR87193.1 multiple drug resistance protein [Kwoniella dejecticola CBS 10117]
MTHVGPETPSPNPAKSAAQTDRPVSSYTLKKYPWRPYVTPFEDILAKKYQGSGTDEDPFIIDWLPNDAEDPQNWSATYKWTCIAVVSWLTLAVALSSSAYTGGASDIVAEFGASLELVIAGVSLFVVGFAFGPLFWAPFSEVFGRRLSYIVSYTFLTIWSGAAAGSPNMASLLVFRFLAGLFGSSPLANAGGTISDVLDANQRGLGMALFAAAPFLGPSLGPITGGFLGLTSGWRWVEGYLTIFVGVMLILVAIFGAETYAPLLLRKRAATLSKATGKVYRFRGDAKKPLQVGPLFVTSLIRPWKFLWFEPIVSILTVYTALIYGILYLNFAAYPIVFQQGHGWNVGIGGLAFLGILIGTIVSVVLSVAFVNPQYIKIAKKKGGRADPEDRLPPAIWGGFLLVIGLAGFAATDGPDVHWIAPIIFGIPFGTGIIIVFLAVLGYLVDSYTIYAASVLAANSVLRSLFGAAFPLFTRQMFDKLGVHWGVALPGFLALACIPFTVLFYKYGAQIRAKCKYAADAEKTMNMLMAAKMAQMKQQDEESAIENGNGNEPSTTKNEGSGATATPAPAGGAIDAQPAEQQGGLSKIESHAAEHSEKPLNRIPSHVPQHLHHEWTIYETLADRDEVDLADDERIRLNELHEKFHYLKHPSKKNQNEQGAVSTTTTTSTARV